MTKIDIFSGFLGAGKTTLIKKLISEAYAGEKLVLIENEFGEIGVDGAFMQEAGIIVNEMNSGCICCSLVGDFGDALKKVLDTYAPDRILIEPSGVGKLSDITKAVEKIDGDIDVNTLTTVVDAKKAKVYMKNFGEFFNNQVENANCIILSRTDGMDEEKLNAAAALLKEHNPHATIITTPWNELDGKAILSAMEQKDTLEKALEELMHEEHQHEEDDDECECHHEHHHHHEEECGCHHEHHHHHEEEECECHHHHHEEEDDEEECGCHHGHEHHHHHHHGHDADEVFVSWGVETPKKYDPAKLQSILDTLADEEKYGQVLRSKGVLDAGSDRWLYFDYVPGEPEIRTGSPCATGRICVIGSKLNEEALTALFEL